MSLPIYLSVSLSIYLSVKLVECRALSKTLDFKEEHLSLDPMYVHTCVCAVYDMCVRVMIYKNVCNVLYLYDVCAVYVCCMRMCAVYVYDDI